MDKYNPFIARRLDYIFITNDLLPFCMESNIKIIGLSDHREVVLLLDFASFERGPWTLNLILLFYKINISLMKSKQKLK